MLAADRDVAVLDEKLRSTRSARPPSPCLGPRSAPREGSILPDPLRAREITELRSPTSSRTNTHACTISARTTRTRFARPAATRRSGASSAATWQPSSSPTDPATYPSEHGIRCMKTALAA